MDVILYAGNPLSPSNIDNYIRPTAASGWSQIILSFLHVHQNPDIIGFNEDTAISNGIPTPLFSNWQDKLRLLKVYPKTIDVIDKLYASIGGGGDVTDWETIQLIYSKNNSSFEGTALEKNLQGLRNAFPAIDGLDMDVEDTYDSPSFVAFCKMAHGMGFEISFCVFGGDSINDRRFWFWINSLQAIEESDWGKGQHVVKRFNLQNYADISPPPDWAAEIKQKLPNFNTTKFMTVGSIARYKDDNNGEWIYNCPASVKDFIVGLMKQDRINQTLIGGGFIWNMDYILQTTTNPAGCNGCATMQDYTDAIRTGMRGG